MMQYETDSVDYTLGVVVVGKVFSQQPHLTSNITGI